MARLSALLLALAFALAACGGGGGVSKDDYADDLDKVCADIEAKTEEIGQADVSGPAELSAQLDEIRTAIRDGIQRMQDIERPDGEDGELAQEYVTKLEKALETQVLPALDELEKAVKAKDQAGIRAAAAKLQAIDEEETDKIAKELGANGCAD
jgi:hypothetical protein